MDANILSNTWAAEVQAYEAAKRPVSVTRPEKDFSVPVTAKDVQTQERVFDPLLQRFRDRHVEHTQRRQEEKERVAHLNRAQDVLILREQPFNIINQSSKLEKIAPGLDPERTQGHAPPPCSYPSTTLDYNIISNHPVDVHHWARPEDRPMCTNKEPRLRKVPAFLAKDHNIITNEYLTNHDAKKRHDRTLNLLETTSKHMKQNRFNPLTQQFSDPRHERDLRSCEDALATEVGMRARAQLPVSFKCRPTEYYDVVTHKVEDESMLQYMDAAEAKRTERYANRYIVEHNIHAQDIKDDHVREARKLNRVAPENFQEERQRGFNIVTNRAFGKGVNCQTLHTPYPQNRKTPWEKVTSGKEPLTNHGPLDNAHGSKFIKQPTLSSSRSSPRLSANIDTNIEPKKLMPVRSEGALDRHIKRTNVDMMASSAQVPAVAGRTRWLPHAVSCAASPSQIQC